MAAMRVAIVGSGAVGSYFGGRLAAAGADVTFIARGNRLAALRRQGLAIASSRGDLHLASPMASDSPTDVGPVDIVLFTVKLWSTEEAGRQLAALVGRNTAVISLQNGVEAHRALAGFVSREHLMGGVCYIAAALDDAGVVAHTGSLARLVFGELDGRVSARAQTFLAACQRAGLMFDAELSADIERAIWEKFVFLVGLSAMTSLTRRPIGMVRTDPATRATLLDVMREVVAVGRAKGIGLAPDFGENRLAFIDTLPAAMTSSMHHDMERGNRLELDWLSGAVLRLGSEAGIDTPANRAVCAALGGLSS